MAMPSFDVILKIGTTAGSDVRQVADEIAKAEDDVLEKYGYTRESFLEKLKSAVESFKRSSELFDRLSKSNLMRKDAE